MYLYVYILELVTDPETPEWCPWHPSQAARQRYVVLFLQLIAQRPIGHDRNALPSTEGKEPGTSYPHPPLRAHRATQLQENDKL